MKKLAELAKLEPGKETFEGKDEKIKIVGDLMLSLDKAAQPSEELSITKYFGKLIDESSPVLLLGDSHMLFLFSGGDMLAENVGPAECLASELKMPINRIGVKGSASTVIRTNLYRNRKTAKDAALIKGKKVIIWCFTAREFTESTSGWVSFRS